MGDICGITKYNKKGQFENHTIIRNIEKLYLTSINHDPLGQKLPLPDIDSKIDVNRKERLFELLDIGENVIWGWKDCKACLSFKSWNYAFPDAHWIIVHRNTDSIINSCLNTKFMSAYDSYEDWYKWAKEYLLT